MRFEEWKPVRGYDGLYEVSSMGRVRALFRVGNFYKPGRILKPWLLRNGYLQVHLTRPKEKRKAFCVHRLLLEAFVGPAPIKCEARHINGVRAENTVKNLAWGTHKENVEDSRRHGTLIEGERAGSSKLTAEEVLEIRKAYFSGLSLQFIAECYDIDRTNVWNIGRYKTWRHI